MRRPDICVTPRAGVSRPGLTLQRSFFPRSETHVSLREMPQPATSHGAPIRWTTFAAARLMLSILRAHVEAVRDGHVDPPAVFKAIAAQVPGVTFDELYEAADFCRAHTSDLIRVWRWRGSREGRRELGLKFSRGTLVRRSACQSG